MKGPRLIELEDVAKNFKNNEFLGTTLLQQLEETFGVSMFWEKKRLHGDGDFVAGFSDSVSVIDGTLRHRSLLSLACATSLHLVQQRQHNIDFPTNDVSYR